MIPFRRHLCWLSCLLFFVTCGAVCRGQEISDVDLMLRFAENLQNRQLYFQSISEFERVFFYSEDPKQKYDAMICVGNSYYLGRQYQRAIVSYRRAIEFAPTTEAREAVLLNIAVASGESAKQAQDTGDLIASVDNLLEFTTSQSGDRAILGAFHVARFSVVLGEREQALRYSALAAQKCRNSGIGDCRTFLELEARLREPPPEKKYPGLGLALSMILPGAGALYSEHYFDSIFYFLGTGASALMAWDVYDGSRSIGNQKATFFTVLGIGAALYIANVVQGYVSVKRLNTSRQHSYVKSINSVTLPPLRQ